MAMGSRSVEIFLIANADKWVKGLDRATAKADEFGRALQKQKKLADMTFKAGAGLVVAAAGMVAATVGPAMALEDAVNRVASLTGKTGAEFTALTAQLTADAKKLSVSMGASLDNVTAAYESAVVNGIDPTTDAFKRFVTQALQVATVTGQDVKTNIALADEVLDRFGKKLADAPDALADLYRMSAAAEGGFAPFLQTISQAGQLAGQLDVPMEQVAASVALMSQHGISGTRAGMALGNMLMRLSGASENAGDSLNKFGIKVIDPTTGKVRNLADVFNDLRGVLQSLPKAEANKLLMDLAGGQGIKALGGLLVDTEGDFRSLFAAIGSGKTLQDAFNERTKTTKFQVDQAKVAINAARADIGDAYLPVLAGMATKVSEVVSAMSPFIRAHADAIVPVTGLTLAVGLGLMAFGKAAIMIRTLTLLMPGLWAAMGPIGIAVGAIATALLLMSVKAKTAEDRIKALTLEMETNRSESESLKTEIAALEKSDAAWIERLGVGNPALVQRREKLAALNREYDKLKEKQDVISFGGPEPKTFEDAETRIRSLTAALEDQKAKLIEGYKREGVYILGYKAQIDTLNTQIGNVIALQAQMKSGELLGASETAALDLYNAALATTGDIAEATKAMLAGMGTPLAFDSAPVNTFVAAMQSGIAPLEAIKTLLEAIATTPPPGGSEDAYPRWIAKISDIEPTKENLAKITELLTAQVGRWSKQQVEIKFNATMFPTAPSVTPDLSNELEAGPMPQLSEEPTPFADWSLEAAEQVDLVQSEYARLLAASSDTTNQMRIAFGTAFEDMTPYALEFADSFISNFERMRDAGKSVFHSMVASFALAMIDMVKMAIRAAIAEIIVVKIREVTKALAEAPLTFGATLAAIAPILAAAAAGIAALNAVASKIESMASGGIIKKTGMILAHAGERVINPAVNTTREVVDMLSGTRLAAAVSPVVSSAGGGGGVAAAPIYFHMPIYGPVSSELDLEKIMRKAADVFRASHGG